MSRLYSRNMFMRLLWLLVQSAVICVSEQNLPFRTIVEQAVAGFKTTESMGFVIPANQCSGFIDESLLCGKEGVVGAVRVVMDERMCFPSVRVDRYLRNVTMARAMDRRGLCPHPARVELHVGCLLKKRNHARTKRLALHPLPPV